jgi:hypothetical protein
MIKVLILLTIVVFVSSRRELPKYELALDKPVEERYAAVVKDFNKTIHGVYDDLINHKFGGILKDLIYPLSK